MFIDLSILLLDRTQPPFSSRHFSRGVSPLRIDASSLWWGRPTERPSEGEAETFRNEEIWKGGKAIPIHSNIRCGMVNEFLLDGLIIIKCNWSYLPITTVDDYFHRNATHPGPLTLDHCTYSWDGSKLAHIATGNGTFPDFGGWQQCEFHWSTLWHSHQRLWEGQVGDIVTFSFGPSFFVVWVSFGWDLGKYDTPDGWKQSPQLGDFPPRLASGAKS